MSHYSQVAVTVSIVVNSCLFEFNESCVNAFIVVVGVILGSGVFFELLLLFLLKGLVLHTNITKDTLNAAIC